MNIARAWVRYFRHFCVLRMLRSVGLAVFTCFAVFATSIPTVAAQEEPTPSEVEPIFPDFAEGLEDEFFEIDPNDVEALETLFTEGVESRGEQISESVHLDVDLASSEGTEGQSESFDLGIDPGAAFTVDFAVTALGVKANSSISSE